MIVVDTSVWIDFVTGRNTLAAVRLGDLLDKDRLVVGDVILLEVLQGFRYDNYLRRAVALL